MRKPTDQELEFIKLILTKSIDELIKRDSSIFNHNEQIDVHLDENVAILNRKLHEVTINHRLAYYLEMNASGTLPFLFADIEYNRFYENPKQLNIGQQIVVARPDIILHSRMNTEVPIQHYLVVEAKKDQITEDDILKVKGFISDDNYSYLFGLTISYCLDANNVVGHLFYYDGLQIISEGISRPKQN
ncbi:hypothetical protein [Flavobacterium terrisoli]|uniref:hypothetical protein n=1 Tax=Flavobacterium terrisoli TaxID=3242195 RepID=UPI0025435C16|nr:hypothetical protein [Flavobacterium buctense]